MADCSSFVKEVILSQWKISYALQIGEFPNNVINFSKAYFFSNTTCQVILTLIINLVRTNFMLHAHLGKNL